MDWFNTNFAWLGLVAAVLLALMLGADRFRSDTNISRWRDLRWVSWAATSAYLLHNVEEYAIDLMGRAYAFPGELCAVVGYGPDCPIPPLFFTAVNVPMFWIVGPIAALLSPRHPLIGLTLYGVIFVNTIVHVAAGLTSGTFYNPGLLTAALIFAPLSIWVGYAFFGRGGLPYTALAFIIAIGVAAHALLVGAVLGLRDGAISPELAIGVQVLNAAMLLVMPWVAERFGVAHGPRAPRPT